MSTAEMKLELHKKIDGLDDQQLEEMYDVFQNYLNGQTDDEWDTLDPAIQASIEQGIKEADNGEVFPLEDVLREVRSKYGLK